jgi:aldehyde dehydrogenase (NAD+)
MATQQLADYRMYIGGEDLAADTGRVYETSDPYTGRPWATVPDGDAGDVDRAVAAARAAFEGEWGRATTFERANLIHRLAELVRRDAAELAEIEMRDSGRLLTDAEGMIGAVAAWLDYFAGLADKLQGEAIPTDPANCLVYTRHEPVGVVGAIVPWNAPLLLTTWKLAPALAAGCTFVVKPSDYTPASMLELARRVDEAGFPAGVVNVVTGFGPPVGQALAGHPDIDKIAFTGSTETGMEVGRRALSNITRLTLELGGKSPQVVFDDADLDAAEPGLASVFDGGGQICFAGTRVFAQEGVYDEVVQRLSRRAQAMRLGDPSDRSTDMGPLVNQRQFDRVMSYLSLATEEGASFATGGDHAREAGDLFVQPTVMTDVRPDMRVMREEIFGPVVGVVPFSSEEEAIRLANDTAFGLAAGVWTTNVNRAHRVAHRLNAGSVWVNAYSLFAPNVPFGGYGISGMGRENGFAVMQAYTETKAVWLQIDESSD